MASNEPTGSAPSQSHSKTPRRAAAPLPRDDGGRLSIRNVLLLAVVLAVATILPYARTWRFDLIYLDDVFFVREGRWFFEDWSNLPKVFTNHVWEFFGQESSLYRPLLLLPRFVETRLFGDDPGPHHILNTILHFAAVSALFALLLRLLDDRRAAIASALLFALHPAHVPTIAWIEGYNNSMTALLVVTSVLLVLVSAQTGRARFALLSGLTWFLALLTKESAVSTPLLALGVVWLWRSGNRDAAKTRGWNRRQLVLIAAGWTLAFAAWFVLRSRAIPETPELDEDYVAASVARGWPGLLLYWGKVWLPFNLVPLPTLKDSSLIFGITAAALYALLTWRSRGQRRRALVLGASWFVLLISPSLLVSRLEMPSGAIFREDRMYQASIGAFIAIAFLLREALAGKRFRVPAQAAAIACAALWLVLSQARLGTYADGLSYWTAAAEGSPRLSLTHQLLAVMYQRAGDSAGEKRELLRALELNPRLPGLNNDIGAMFIRLGSYTEADRYFQAELALYPDSDKAHYNRALLQFHNRDYAEATKSIDSYLRITRDPTDSVRQRNARAMQADIDRATRDAVEARPVAEEVPARRPGAST